LANSLGLFDCRSRLQALILNPITWSRAIPPINEFQFANQEQRKQNLCLARISGQGNIGMVELGVFAVLTLIGVLAHGIYAHVSDYWE
jgi:hypothetical protein